MLCHGWLFILHADSAIRTFALRNRGHTALRPLAAVIAHAAAVRCEYPDVKRCMVRTQIRMICVPPALPARLPAAPCR